MKNKNAILFLFLLFVGGAGCDLLGLRSPQHLPVARLAPGMPLVAFPAVARPTVSQWLDKTHTPVYPAVRWLGRTVAKHKKIALSAGAIFVSASLVGCFVHGYKKLKRKNRDLQVWLQCPMCRDRAHGAATVALYHAHCLHESIRRVRNACPQCGGGFTADQAPVPVGVDQVPHGTMCPICHGGPNDLLEKFRLRDGLEDWAQFMKKFASCGVAGGLIVACGAELGLMAARRVVRYPALSALFFCSSMMVLRHFLSYRREIGLAIQGGRAAAQLQPVLHAEILREIAGMVRQQQEPGAHEAARIQALAGQADPGHVQAGPVNALPAQPHDIRVAGNAENNVVPVPQAGGVGVPQVPVHLDDPAELRRLAEERRLWAAGLQRQLGARMAARLPGNAENNAQNNAQ